MLKVLFAILFFSLSSFSAEHVISQKDKKFSKTKIKVKMGDTLVFKNDDPIVHNVYANDKGNKFLIKVQTPKGTPNDKSTIKIEKGKTSLRDPLRGKWSSNAPSTPK